MDEVVPGYSGGHVDNPTYDQYCGKKTGHAEVVRVTFDPDVIPMTLLRVFHTLFDPTQLNRHVMTLAPRRSSSTLTRVRRRMPSCQEVSEYYDAPVVTEVVLW